MGIERPPPRFSDYICIVSSPAKYLFFVFPVQDRKRPYHVRNGDGKADAEYGQPQLRVEFLLMHPLGRVLIHNNPHHHS